MTREELKSFKDWWNLNETGHACITDVDIDEYLKSLPPADATAEEISAKDFVNKYYQLPESRIKLVRISSLIKCLERFAAQRQPQPTAMDGLMLTISEDGVDSSKCNICGKPALEHGWCYEHEVCYVPKQPTAEGAEAFWQEKEKGMIKSIGLESMKSDKLYLPNEMWQFAEEFATLTADKIVEGKYADTEADGYVFCGKCGKMKEI